MPRQTNKQIFTSLYIQVEARIKEIINEHYPNGFIKKLYRVSPNGNIEIYTVTGGAIFTGYYDMDKPTRKDVERIVEYLKNFPKYKLEDIIIKYSTQGNGYTTYGAVKVSDISKNYLTNFADAQAKLKQLKEYLESEQILLDTGHYIRCQRCQKVVATKDAKHMNIIGRGRKRVWNSWKNRMDDKACVTSEPMVFCSGECAGHEQMSREG